jgi:hypothetical protein
MFCCKLEISYGHNENCEKRGKGEWDIDNIAEEICNKPENWNNDCTRAS